MLLSKGYAWGRNGLEPSHHLTTVERLQLVLLRQGSSVSSFAYAQFFIT